MPAQGTGRARLLLLLPTTSYRAQAFMRAADALGIALTVASEEDSAFSDEASDALLTFDFRDPAACVAVATTFHARHPLAGVFGVDDRTAYVAACIADALDLRGNPPEAARAAGDKALQRERLARAGVPVPAFSHHEDRGTVDPAGTPYPAVLKPVSLSASQGVMRVDDPTALETGLARLEDILSDAAPPDERSFLVEAFIPGREFALEGLLEGGRLTTLALFDKPDPLDGPYFAETIYTTPSRAPEELQAALRSTARAACAALGLTCGPVHVELRHNERGPWIVELAARPIGGRCGEVLSFDGDGSTSLETVLLAHALGPLDREPSRTAGASGVFMLPVQNAGVVRAFEGLDEALAVPGVVDISITIHRGATVRPLPEEARYLGFVFARGDGAMQVEEALRAAAARLQVEVR